MTDSPFPQSELLANQERMRGLGDQGDREAASSALGRSGEGVQENQGVRGKEKGLGQSQA